MTALPGFGGGWEDAISINDLGQMIGLSDTKTKDSVSTASSGR
jgi:hypothetical protein